MLSKIKTLVKLKLHLRLNMIDKFYKTDNALYKINFKRYKAEYRKYKMNHTYCRSMCSYYRMTYNGNKNRN